MIVIIDLLDRSLISFEEHLINKHNNNVTLLQGLTYEVLRC